MRDEGGRRSFTFMGASVMRARVFAVVGLACIIGGIALLLRHPPETDPEPAPSAHSAEAEWPEVVNSFDQWIESGPRRTGFSLMLAGGVCALITFCMGSRRG